MPTRSIESCCGQISIKYLMSSESDLLQRKLPVQQHAESLANIGVDDLLALLLQPHPGQSNMLLTLIEELDSLREFDKKER